MRAEGRLKETFMSSNNSALYNNCDVLTNNFKI